MNVLKKGIKMKSTENVINTSEDLECINNLKIGIIEMIKEINSINHLERIYNLVTEIWLLYED